MYACILTGYDTRSFNVKAENGKELPVVIVITKLLEFFKREFIGEYSEFSKDHKPALPSISHIMWILTVPAIWSLAAKQIMKDAAKMVCYRVYIVFSYVCIVK